MKLDETGSYSMGDGYDNAGFDSLAFFFNAADIILLLLITVGTLIVILLLRLMLRPWKWAHKKIDKRAENYKATAFIEFFYGIYLVLLLSCAINLNNLSSYTIAEMIQSTISVVFSIFLFASPLLLSIFTCINLDIIRDEDHYERKQFMLKYKCFWEDLDVSRLPSLFYNFVVMFVKCLYVLDILMFPDCPLI
jgi:hypothetical protein